MGFKEKLENLRLEEERKKELERAAEERRRKSLAEQKEKIEAGFKQLEELAKTELQPLLELVNDVYLGGRGQIRKLERSDYSTVDRRYSLKDWNCRYAVSLSLGWGRRRAADGTVGESLKVELGDNGVARIRGGSSCSPERFVRTDDKDVRQKLEDSVYKILTTPEACTWFSPDPDNTR